MQGIINEILTVSRIMTNQIDMSLGPVNPAVVGAEGDQTDYEPALQQRGLTSALSTDNWLADQTARRC
jgi:hypothetical protein